MKNKTHIASLAVMLTAASTALAAVTNVAPSGTIIQSSGSFDANFSPAHVIDGLTNEGPFEPAGYWLGPAGKTSGYFILDLMGEYPVSSITLFNTHGGATEDSGTASFAITASDTAGPGTVSLDRFYPFNGNLNDYSSNAVNAVEVDSSFNPITSPVFSNSVPKVLTNLTQSVSFSGNGESVEITDPAGFVQPTVFSYAMWIECETNYFGFLSPTSFILRTASQGKEGNTWSHQIRLNAGGTFEAYLWDGAGKTVVGTTVVQPNVWYHVAVTAENGGLEQLYVNGVEEGTAAPVGTMWTGGTMTEIGTGSGGGFSASSELISDVGIWYSLLSAANIASLAKGTSPASITAAGGLTLINPKAVASGTLTNVTGQTNITPNVYNLSTPVTARYWRFDALSCDYTPEATNSIGLDEIQLFASVSVPTITTLPAVELTWPVSPFPLLTSTNLLSTNWVPVEGTPAFNGSIYTVSGAPTLAGTNFSSFFTPSDRADFFALSGPSSGATVSTNVARGGRIIYASSTYTGPTFPPSCLIDGITSESTNVCAIQPPIYWLATDADTNATFVLDLQRDYSITSVSLYNTHNGSCNDRGTAQFTLDAIDGIGTTTNETEAGLVLARYLPFNGNVTDVSTNKADAVVLDSGGNVIAGTYSPNVPAVLAGGESIVLSRNGNEVVIYDATNTTSGASVYGEPTAYSLSFWVNFQDLSLQSCILDRTDSNGPSNDYSHEVRMLPTGQFESWLCCTAGDLDGTTVAQPGVWYHVAVTALEGGYEHLYINGNEEGTPVPVALGAMWKGGDRWVLGPGCGAGPQGNGDFAALSGEVTGLAIWYSALSAEQVKALYGGAKPTSLTVVTNITTATQFLNPRPVASGTLSDVDGEDPIIPDVFPVSPPVSARYLQFKALSGDHALGYIGLNEIEVFSAVAAPKQSISHALLLTWPNSPFNLVLQSSPDNSTWTTVSAQATLVGTTWQLYQPNTGLYYRLSTQ